MQTTETYQLKSGDLVEIEWLTRSKKWKHNQNSDNRTVTRIWVKKQGQSLWGIVIKGSPLTIVYPWANFLGLLSDWKVRVEMKSAIPTLFTLVCSLSPPRWHVMGMGIPQRVRGHYQAKRKRCCTGKNNKCLPQVLLFYQREKEVLSR